MKKNILVFLSALLLLNISAMAANSQDKAFYLKAIMGGNKISGIKTIDQDIHFKVTQNSRISQTVGLGIGYYINPRIRGDIIFENASFSFIPKKGDFYFIDANGLNTGNQLIKRNANIQTIMLNTYVNLITKGSFKIFGGFGIGSSNIKEKITSEFKVNDVVINGQLITIPAVVETESKKVKNSLAYAITIGSDIDLAKNFHLDLAYSWKHYGKVKDCKNRYEGHNMSAAIRFDL